MGSDFFHWTRPLQGAISAGGIFFLLWWLGVDITFRTWWKAFVVIAVLDIVSMIGVAIRMSR